MIVRSHFNLNATVLKLVLIYLLSLPIFSNFAFAQDPNFSNSPSVDEKFFVLVNTQNKSLNVRKDPSIASPIVGRLLKGAEVPLVDINGDGGTNGNWFRVEIKNKKIGWISKNYSRKIKKQNQTANVRAVNPTDKDQSTDKTAKKTKPWANIDGFRSAKFGMTMQAVKKAIIKDFSIPEDKIKIINHPIELTKSLGVTVENLIPESRKSRVVYVFGFESKQLTQVNILTGHPMDTNATPEEIINSGNLLGEHFLKKRYQEKSLLTHAKLSDGSILIFRGKDQNGHMVMLSVSNSKPVNETPNEPKIRLNLSYIEKPGRPDIYNYKLKDGDF